jgi:scyllo-inositol 2-dehydrogenase (NADP+)
MKRHRTFRPDTGRDDLSTYAPSPLIMSDPIIKVAFVGYGYTHRTFHLPAILLCPEFKVHAFVQRKEFPIDKRTGQPGPSCVDDYPEAIRYVSMEDMLKDGEVELVVVVTPGPSHAQLCIQALEAGKNGACFC